MAWSRSAFWKGFLFIWLVYSAFVVVASAGLGAVIISSALLLIFLLVNAMPLFGLAYERAVGWLMVWRVYFFVMLAIVIYSTWFNVVKPVIDLGIGGVSAALADQAAYLPYLVPLVMIIQIVNLYGLYLYVFDSAELWNAKGMKKAKQTKRRARAA